MIHDRICESRKTNSIDFYAEVVWVRLLTKADDNGNYYRDVRRIHANCMLEKPRASEDDTEKAIKALLKVGLLKEYEADDRKYIHLTDFHEWQELRTDKNAHIDHPVHPPRFGGAYIGEGLRRDTWVNQFQREAEAGGEPTGDRPVTHSEPEGRPKGEVEVKEEVEGEDEGTHHHPDGNFRRFQEAFKQAVGRATKPKAYPTAVERYTDLCRRFGENEVLDAINAYVALHGKAVLYKNKYADRNFLIDEAEDLIKAKQDGTLNPPAEQEADEVSRVAGPRGVRPELMR